LFIVDSDIIVLDEEIEASGGMAKKKSNLAIPGYLFIAVIGLAYVHWYGWDYKSYLALSVVLTGFLRIVRRIVA